MIQTFAEKSNVWYSLFQYGRGKKYEYSEKSLEVVVLWKLSTDYGFWTTSPSQRISTQAIPLHPLKIPTLENSHPDNFSWTNATQDNSKFSNWGSCLRGYCHGWKLPGGYFLGLELSGKILFSANWLQGEIIWVVPWVSYPLTMKCSPTIGWKFHIVIGICQEFWLVQPSSDVLSQISQLQYIASFAWFYDDLKMILCLYCYYLNVKAIPKSAEESFPLCL